MCRLCGFKGHYQSHCPVATNTDGHWISNDDAVSSITGSREVRQASRSWSFNQHATANGLNPLWILLDSESTDNFFSNKLRHKQCNHHHNFLVAVASHQHYLLLHLHRLALAQQQLGKPCEQVRAHRHLLVSTPAQHQLHNHQHINCLHLQRWPNGYQMTVTWTRPNPLASHYHTPSMLLDGQTNTTSAVTHLTMSESGKSCHSSRTTTSSEPWQQADG